MDTQLVTRERLRQQIEKDGERKKKGEGHSISAQPAGTHAWFLLLLLSKSKPAEGPTVLMSGSETLWSVLSHLLLLNEISGSCSKPHQAGIQHITLCDRKRNTHADIRTQTDVVNNDNGLSMTCSW